ncbi:GNAT family N-acetyltransferase [Pseudozobellia thermophila]|uniref:Acetyltransferase (GNAT) family protein n=1 Tax=Pseudozobellia thermophila TaxID=192903 RepID=A0A1M6B455_9FLAO|nr:GNAT family N-acetyltransferase [Pseudozobellia thermophila]SHI43521.1 Acetyltransferase (GNAT) family protein [Pseudozobellia thermophila]
MIRHAKLSDIPQIMTVVKACTREMIGRDIYQWNDLYPSRQAFENDLERKELFVLEADSEIVGAIVISSLMDEEYKAVRWLTQNGANSYIHRLCVHPDHQGRGHAGRMMAFAEQLARGKGLVSVRLDTFSRNKRNQRFYEKRGYKRLGDIFFPKQSGHPFHCYELVL